MERAASPPAAAVMVGGASFGGAPASSVVAVAGEFSVGGNRARTAPCRGSDACVLAAGPARRALCALFLLLRELPRPHGIGREREESLTDVRKTHTGRGEESPHGLARHTWL